jgi:entericidin A
MCAASREPLPDLEKQETPMKTVLLIVTAMFTLTACNTMQGLGQDVQKVGQKIEDKAEKKK